MKFTAILIAGVGALANAQGMHAAISKPSPVVIMIDNVVGLSLSLVAMG